MKPCPFCGSTHIQVFEYPYMKPGLSGCFVFCARCGAQTGKYDTTDKAKKAWNKRESEEQHR